jgi:hypothetical protein
MLAPFELIVFPLIVSPEEDKEKRMPSPFEVIVFPLIVAFEEDERK